MSLPPSAIQYQEEHINDNDKPSLIAASAICLSAAYIAVSLRLVSRYVARNALGADDYTILIALFFTSIFVITVLIDVSYGLGRHLILVTNGAAFGKVSSLSTYTWKFQSDLPWSGRLLWLPRSSTTLP